MCRSRVDYRKLGKVLLLVGVLVGAIGMYYIWLRPKIEEKLPPPPPPPPKKDEEPPEIRDFKWEPIRVVNDKVYDGVTLFLARDEKSRISEASLIFAPKVYSHLPSEAFPNDTIKKFVLRPLDGTFDENVEEFLANITDIKGGREYDIEVTVKDEAGNIAVASLTTPYIREFENFGKQLYEKGTKIGIIYGLITKQHEWDDYLKLGGPYEPLLGYYVLNSTRDLIVIERHMDWMSGHGINFVLGLWSGKELEGNILDKMYKEALSTLDIFKTGGMKFGISYTRDEFQGQPGINMSDPRNIQIIKEDLPYLTENYFRHPAYLKIDGKPFFYIYMNKGMYGDVVGGLKEVYKFLKEKYGIQLYMVSDHALPEVNEDWYYHEVKDLAPLFDAMVTGIHYGPGYQQWGSWEDFLEMGFKHWYNFSLRNGLDYIPFVNPGASMKYCGWHPPELRESDPFAYPRSVEFWKKRLEISIPYSNTFGIMVGDFNNVMENGHIEPTVQEGFEYLKAMKEVLTKYFL